MKIRDTKELEKVLKEIREREAFIKLLNETYVDRRVAKMQEEEEFRVGTTFLLSGEEIDFLEETCQDRIEELKKLIKPLFD